MAWHSVEFGTSHEGRAGAVLADGSEPGPRYFGSAGYTYESTDWWGYDGKRSTPKATHLRGSCSCGWRGAELYPIDWTAVDWRRAYAHEVDGPLGDWERHVAEVEAEAVPMPDEVTELMARLNAELVSLAAHEPLAALRVVGGLERMAVNGGLRAVGRLSEGELSEAAVAKALGVTEREIRSRMLRYWPMG